MKILRKRSTIITLVLGILLTAFSCLGTLMGNYYIDGEVFESNYEAMVKEREYIRGLSGREISSDLLSETIEAYSRIPPTEGSYINTQEYQKYARPYYEIYHLIRKVYNLSDRKEMSAITDEDLEDFYTVRQSRIDRNIESTTMSSAEKANSKNINRQVKTPFIYSYTDGYKRLISQMYTTAIIICFISTICIAPLFAGEYVDRMDSLILSSKYGKNKIIAAKLFTGISFTILLSLGLSLISYVTVMMFYGWEGGGSPIQFLVPLSIVPFTMGKVVFLYFLLILFGNILSSALAMVLSAKFKSPYLVVVIMTVITILPMFVNVSENIMWIYHLFNLIPANMFSVGNIIDSYSIELFGLMLKPYELIIIFAIISSAALLPFAYRSFKNHN